MKCAQTAPSSSHVPYSSPARWIENASAWLTYLRATQARRRERLGWRRVRGARTRHARLEDVGRLAVEGEAGAARLFLALHARLLEHHLGDGHVRAEGPRRNRHGVGRDHALHAVPEIQQRAVAHAQRRQRGALGGHVAERGRLGSQQLRAAGAQPRTRVSARLRCRDGVPPGPGSEVARCVGRPHCADAAVAAARRTRPWSSDSVWSA